MLSKKALMSHSISRASRPALTAASQRSERRRASRSADEPLSADDALRQFKDYKAGLIDGELEQGIWVGSTTYGLDTTTPFDSLAQAADAKAKSKPSKLQAAVASNARDAMAAVVSRKPSAKVDSKVGRSRVCKRPSHSLQKRPAVFQRPAALKQP